MLNYSNKPNHHCDCCPGFSRIGWELIKRVTAQVDTKEGVFLFKFEWRERGGGKRRGGKRKATGGGCTCVAEIVDIDFETGVGVGGDAPHVLLGQRSKADCRVYGPNHYYLLFDST